MAPNSRAKLPVEFALQDEAIFVHGEYIYIKGSLSYCIGKACNVAYDTYYVYIIYRGNKIDVLF